MEITTMTKAGGSQTKIEEKKDFYPYPMIVFTHLWTIGELNGRPPTWLAVSSQGERTARAEKAGVV